MTSDEKIDVLLGQAEAVVKLLALQTISGKKTGEAVAVLDRAGLERRVIADVLNTSQDSVRALISANKKPKGKSAKSTKEASLDHE